MDQYNDTSSRQLHVEKQGEMKVTGQDQVAAHLWKDEVLQTL